MSNHDPSYTPNEGLRNLAEQLVADWPPLTADQKARIGSMIGGAA